MPTTKPQPTPRAGQQHRFVRLLVLMGFAILLNTAASFVLEPVGSLNAVAWSDYRAANKLDTLIVGSSYAQRGIDPAVLDEGLASSTINLATPGQSLVDSYDAVQAVLAERPLKRVIVGCGYNTMCEPLNIRAHIPYLRARYQGNTLGYIRAAAELACSPTQLGTRDSINALCFPWVYNPVRSFTGMASNVHAHLTGEPVGLAAEKVTPNWRYHGQGYGNYTTVLDRRHTQDSAVSVYGELVMRSECLDALERIAQLCQEADVDLYVVITPHTAFDIMAFGENYAQGMAQVQARAEAHGGHYFDFNMARGGVGYLDDACFYDFEHLNDKGAAEFTRKLATTLVAFEQARSTSAHNSNADTLLANEFYDYAAWEHYLASITQIDQLCLEAAMDGSSPSFTAQALTGVPQGVEFAFYAGADESSLQLMRDFSDDPQWRWENAPLGPQLVMVEARRSGTSEVERSFVLSVIL